jgi:transposase-like protein
MAKHDESVKLELVRRYLSGSIGTRELAKQYGVGRTSLRSWVDRYREHGAKGLRKKYSQYSAQFKLSVLSRMKRDPRPPEEDAQAHRNPTATGGRRAHSGVATQRERGPARGGGVPKKIGGLGSSQSARCAERAQAVLERRPHHSLPMLLRAAGLSRSTFYYQAKVLEAGDRYASLKSSIQAV